MEKESSKRKGDSNMTLDSNCNKRLKANQNYCFLCQDYGHELSDNCSVNAVCLLCGVRGHVRQDCPASHNEDALLSFTAAGSSNGRWIESVPQQFKFETASQIIPVISQENVVLESSKDGEMSAVTLLAKVDASESVEYVRIIPKMGEGTKLSTGVHKCIGDQESNTGGNNVFVTVVIEHEQQTKNVKIGETLGYAKIINKNRSKVLNNFFTNNLECGMAKLKLEQDVSLQQGGITIVEVAVDSLPRLPSGNHKNYPVQFESTIKLLGVIGDRYTIQNGNSIKVKIRNSSENQIILRNGDIVGRVKSLISNELIEKIQRSHRSTVHLPLDHVYSLVFLEIETIRASNLSEIEITQIGCYSSPEKRFFKVIEPSKLNYYLDNFQIAGDLLQCLNMQKNGSGHFEYRKQFEILENSEEAPKCIPEKEALQALAVYLRSFSSDCILISIKKETIKLVIERMNYLEIDVTFLKGFCTWDSYVKNTIENGFWGAGFFGNEDGSYQEFDDWYNEEVNDQATSNLNAETVASMLKEAIDLIYESNSSSVKILQASSPMESLTTDRSEENPGIVDIGGPPTFLELYNSFRPNFPTTITMTNLETVEISSDEDLFPIPQSKPSIPDFNVKGHSGLECGWHELLVYHWDCFVNEIFPK